MIRLEIIKEYVASLKEDGELDYIFPLLLERMGYRVLSTPKHSKGQSQYGRDVVAIKKVKGDDILYLFELKGFRARDITDRALTEKDGIIDSLKASKYSKYRDASIPGLSQFARRYVFVHNGGVDANALQTWNDFVQIEFPENNLERWDLVKLTELFSKYLFDETLLADERSYRLFKKVLVLLDAEGNDYSDIKALIELQIEKFEKKSDNPRAILNGFATLRLIAAMVHFYAKEDNNLYPAKYCIDTVVLKTWAWILKNKKEKRKAIVNHFNSLVHLQMHIYAEYIEKILPFEKLQKGLYAFHPRETEFVFYPLRCYDFLGDLIYLFCLLEAYAVPTEQEVRNRVAIIKNFIRNNSACTMPLLDTHSIPIQMVFRYMYFRGKEDDDVKCLGDFVVDSVINLSKRYHKQKMWPEMSGNRMALAKSLYEKSDDYGTDSSVLLMNIFELIAYLNIPSAYTAFKKVVEESGVNLQVAYPIQDEYDIEQVLFEHRLNDEMSVETHIKLPETIDDFHKNYKKKYSSIKYRTDRAGYGFLRLLAHKYYETDMFPDFLGRKYCKE